MNLKTKTSTAARFLCLLLAGLSFVPFAGSLRVATAAAPTGNEWFEIHAEPFTGKDDTGDGGTGSAADLNYFYVGQTFTGRVAMKALSSNAANLWLDYDPTVVQPSNLSAGSFYNSSAGFLVGNGRIKATGYNFPNSNSTGEGTFASAKLTLQKPSAANYGTGTPATMRFNLGSLSQTTESNISYNGQDLLDSAEDFRMNVWADTKKPYALSPIPASGSTNVPVTSNYAFQIRDSLRGEGDNTGVGTGVNMNSAQAKILISDGGTPIDFRGSATFTCSGIWGSNVCDVTINPPPATAFPGDTRKWKYNTLYTVTIQDYEDLASSNQSQLGDPNGPNKMDSKSFTFRTEADTVLPQILNALPTASSVDNALNTLLSFEVADRSTYPNGISGSGVNPLSCRIDVSSPSFPLKTFKPGDPEWSTSSTSYGLAIVLDPVRDFSSNETVSVKVHSCADAAGNKALDKSFAFKTVVLDSDKDGVLDSIDNCPSIANADQKDLDNDKIGDVCDADVDGDAICDKTIAGATCKLFNNAFDNCTSVPNADQKNTTQEWADLFASDPVKFAQYKDVAASPFGDACNPDIDADGIPNGTDNCLLSPNADQKNTDKEFTDLFKSDAVKYVQYATVVGDLLGDACDEDLDGDGVLNATDNCTSVPNADQKNTTREWADLFASDPVKFAQYKDVAASPFGDACNDDIDGDTVKNAVDNCPLAPNLDQKDTDNNGFGDACEAGLTLYQIGAKPQKRVMIGGKQDLGLSASLKFQNIALGKISLDSPITLNSEGLADFNTKLLPAGSYNIGLKGDVCLTKIIPNATVVPAPSTNLLDFTLGKTFELIVGDLYPDDRISSFDLAKMLKVYGSIGAQPADLNKDGRVNAMDSALLNLNYMKKGDSFPVTQTTP